MLTSLLQKGAAFFNVQFFARTAIICSGPATALEEALQWFANADIDDLPDNVKLKKKKRGQKPRSESKD